MFCQDRITYKKMIFVRKVGPNICDQTLMKLGLKDLLKL